MLSYFAAEVKRSLVRLTVCTLLRLAYPCAGRGAVFSYDAVGSHERVGYACQVDYQSVHSADALLHSPHVCT